MSSLPKAFTWKRTGQDSNPRDLLGARKRYAIQATVVESKWATITHGFSVKHMQLNSNHVGRPTVTFDAFGVIARRRARVASGTDTAPVDTDGSTLAVVELGTAAFVQLPCMIHHMHTLGHSLSRHISSVYSQSSHSLPRTAGLE